MLYFQGMPFERDEDFCTAIEIVAEAIAGYPLAQYGLELDADAAPRFEFWRGGEERGENGPSGQAGQKR